jgi:predicted  nucleic acid-binding Zn-ribbon protein
MRKTNTLGGYMDTEEKIKGLQARIKKAEQDKALAEAQYKVALDQLSDLEKQMEAAGVSSNTIESTIAKIELDIEKGIEKIEALMPEV